jgi:hypothetical protein
MMNNTAPKAIENLSGTDNGREIESGVGGLSVPADGLKSLNSLRVPNIKGSKKRHSRKKSTERKILTGGQIVHGGGAGKKGQAIYQSK